MADTNYQTGVYIKRPGDELVIADGGTLTMEDGSAMALESGGELSIESGGKITLESGGSFKYYSTEFTGDKLENMMKSLYTFTDYYRSGAVSFFNVSQLATNYGYHCWSGDTTMSLGSVTLAVPDSGCIIFLNGQRLAGDGNLSVLTSGCSVLNTGSVEISSFEISAVGYAKLVAGTVAAQWIIVDADITEHLAA